MRRVIEYDKTQMDVLQLRFRDDSGNLTTLNAAHVAESLQGLVGLASDFAKAGAFGDGVPRDLEVRPPREGSFVLEVVNWISAHPGEVEVGAGIVGVPTLSSVLVWATKSARAQVADFEYLENGKVKVIWQDQTAEEIPVEAWDELQKRKRRRKKQLRQITAALSENDVDTVEIRGGGGASEIDETSEPVGVLDVVDYRLAAPVEEVEEDSEIFEAEAEMATINFDPGAKWRVRIKGSSARLATLEDEDFLAKVASGLALHKTDIYRLMIREDRTTKNGRTTSEWTVLKVLNHKQAA